MSDDGCMVRKPWELSFLAEPREVAGLRRVVSLHLKLWGLSRQSEAAQLCVNELVSHVIRHVGVGTPTSLRLSMNDTFLRIEVKEPEFRVLSTPSLPSSGTETDMGLMVVSGIADRWGVLAEPDCRITWCEIATDLTTPHGHSGGARVTRAEAMISLYGAATPHRGIDGSLLTVAMAKGVVIEMIVDLLRWVDAHGYDADDVLDAAQTRFDVGL